MWRFLIRPILFLFDPEWVHYFAMGLFAMLLKVPGVRALHRAWTRVDDPSLDTEVAGIRFSNPVGLAAGFDKNALWFNELEALGFGHVEVGTLTGHAQQGNDKPRIFRLPQDRALINRLGFNNRGSEAAAASLDGATIRPILGINIGKSKIVPNDEATSDYLKSFNRLYQYANYITVNVSSPNTPGLRELQGRDALTELLGAIANRNRELAVERGEEPRPVFVKIAPDLNSEQVDDVVALVREVGITGIIATNTTIEREPLSTDEARIEAIGNGGLSGAPLTRRSRDFVASLYEKTGGEIPIIGVGGIMSGEDAYEMLRAGASLVQVYTGFVYGGPGFVRSINRYIAARVRAEGKRNVGEIVGSAHAP